MRVDLGAVLAVAHDASSVGASRPSERRSSGGHVGEVLAVGAQPALRVGTAGDDGDPLGAGGVEHRLHEATGQAAPAVGLVDLGVDQHDRARRLVAPAAADGDVTRLDAVDAQHELAAVGVLVHPDVALVVHRSPHVRSGPRPASILLLRAAGRP